MVDASLPPNDGPLSPVVTVQRLTTRVRPMADGSYLRTFSGSAAPRVVGNYSTRGARIAREHQSRANLRRTTHLARCRCS
jgi:hypothetical protein